MPVRACTAPTTERDRGAARSFPPRGRISDGHDDHRENPGAEERRGEIAPGDLAVVDVDLVVMIDLSFGQGSWREVLKVHDPEKVVVVFDHDVPASNRAAAAMHARGREFARRFGIRRVHDVGPDQGISHVVVAENAYALPGTVMACSDSHTCSAGALNCAARGLGAPDLLYALTTGKTWFRVGETVRYDLDGQFRGRAYRRKTSSSTSPGPMAITRTRMSSSAGRRSRSCRSTRAAR